MLAREHRLTTADDFRAASRGRRAGGRGVVVHVRVPPDVPDGADAPPTARVGFVAGRSVGPAVVRNRVRRRLRHLAGARLELLPAGALVSVRVLPTAAQMSSAELGADLDRCLERCLNRATRERAVVGRPSPRGETVGQ